MPLAPGQMLLPPPPNPFGLVETATRPRRNGSVELIRGPGWKVPVREWRGLWSQRLFAEETITPEEVITSETAATGSGYTDPDSGLGSPADGGLMVSEEAWRQSGNTPLPAGVVLPPKPAFNRLGLLPVRTRRDTPQLGPRQRFPVVEPPPPPPPPPPVVDPPHTIDAAIAWLETRWNLTPKALYQRFIDLDFTRWGNLQASILADGFLDQWDIGNWNSILLLGYQDLLEANQGPNPLEIDPP